MRKLSVRTLRFVEYDLPRTTILTAYPPRIEYSGDMRPVLVIGEVIASKDGPIGAGANLAQRLAKQTDHPVMLVTRIGHGETGSALISALEAENVDCSAVQFDYDLPTLRSHTVAHEHIPPSAHDQLQWDSDLESLACRAALIVSSSGIRRKGQARSTCDRALLAAEGVPRVFMAGQDIAALGPLSRSLIGRATELNEVIVVSPEALDVLRLRTSEDAKELLLNEHLSGVIVLKQEALELTTAAASRTLPCPKGVTMAVDTLLKSLAEGAPITQALAEMT